MTAKGSLSRVFIFKKDLDFQSLEGDEEGSNSS